MSLHEVPKNLDPVNVAGAEGVVVAVVCVALDNLLAGVTAAPQLTHPAVRAVHVGGVLLRLGVAVHVGDDLLEVLHLDVVIPAVSGLHRVVRTSPQVASHLGGPGNGVIIQAVEVDDTDRGVGHRVESQQGRAAHRPDRRQGARQTLQGLGVDEHAAIGGSGHVDLVSVHTPAVQDVV